MTVAILTAPRGVRSVEAIFERGKALIAYLVAGHPSVAASRECIQAAIEGGADLVEVGVPFSDPIADGKTIQAAGEIGLRNGMTLRRSLELIAEIRRAHSTPMVVMSYYNPILRLGCDNFVKEAMNHGVDGMIVPDMIPEEAGDLAAASTARDFAFIHLEAPNSGDTRLEYICRSSTGFIYCLGLEGVTGERDSLQDSIGPFLSRARKAEERTREKGKKKAIAVGFGVSRPEHVRKLSGLADGVIVGSAVVRRAGESPEAVARFIRELKSALC